MTHIISVSVSDEFYGLARQYKISWSEAMRIGLSISFGDKGIKTYDNNLNIVRKFDIIRQKLEEKIQELTNYSEKLKKSSEKLDNINEKLEKSSIGNEGVS